MAALLLTIVLALYHPVSMTAPWNKPAEIPLAPPENGFVFPRFSFDFPDQFLNISFTDEKLILEKGNHSFNAFFAIPINESDSVHEVYLVPEYTTLNLPAETLGDSLMNYSHEQRFSLLSRPENKFSWKALDGDIKVNVYSTGCITYMVGGSHQGGRKIEFYTNGTATTYDDYKKACDIQVIIP